MREFEVCVPLYYDGAPIEPSKIERIGSLSLDEFGGVTFFPQRNKGSWMVGDVVFHDEVVIFRVLTRKGQALKRRTQGTVTTRRDPCGC